MRWYLAATRLHHQFLHHFHTTATAAQPYLYLNTQLAFHDFVTEEPNLQENVFLYLLQLLSTYGLISNCNLNFPFISLSISIWNWRKLERFSPHLPRNNGKMCSENNLQPLQREFCLVYYRVSQDYADKGLFCGKLILKAEK